ncbi:MAG TPA: hypothetical protein VIH85_03875 [Solirubrobacteraceae bacterium]
MPPGAIVPPAEPMPLCGAERTGASRLRPAPPDTFRLATNCATGMTGSALPAARAAALEAGVAMASSPALDAGGPAKIWPRTPS